MAFGDHWEWRGFGDLKNAIQDQIQQLTPKYGAGINVTDQYLWVPACKVNVKVREKDLKFKYLLDKADGGFERWKEDEKDNYPFPLNAAVLAQLEKALATAIPADIYGKTVDTSDSLIDLLPRCTPPVTCVAIKKFRLTYVYPIEGAEILVELAEIENVEIDGQQQRRTLTSVSLESADVGMMRTVRDTLGLPDSLQVKGYLQLIEEMVQTHP
jgi:hypothetical protein